MSDPVEPAAEPAAPPSADGAAEPPKQKWRFRARRVADGSELIAPVLELPFRPVALPAPKWPADDNPNDSTVPLVAEIAGFDGRKVRFLVEEEDGQGGWKLRQVVHAPLEGGKATAQVHLTHPQGEAEPDLTPEPHPEPGAPDKPLDPQWYQSHGVRARAELI